MRGAWIEIIMIFLYPKPFWSLPMRGAWIEIFKPFKYKKFKAMSLPMRGAWIEICMGSGSCGVACVAPHAGSVD